MRQEPCYVPVSSFIPPNVASSKQTLPSAFCLACGDVTESNGIVVICNICLMIFDNTSNRGLILKLEQNEKSSVMESNQLTLNKGSTESTITEETSPSVHSCTESSTPDQADSRLFHPRSKSSLCLVCGAYASGLHFGVFTCEGCKCFYRRTIKECVTYVCTKSKECTVTMETRNSCRYCRFQKCISLGMCKEGIKLGRRPKVDGDICFSDRKGEMNFSNKNVQRWHSWPTVNFPSNHLSGIKQEPIYPADMHGCSSYHTNSMYPPKQQCFSYNKQNLMQNEMMHEPLFINDFNPDIYQVAQSSFSNIYQNTFISNSSHMSNSSHIPNSHAISTHVSNSSHSNSSHMSASSHMPYPSNAYHQNPTPEPISPSLSMTIPEVHSGSFTAMAYANMYRGHNAHDSNDGFTNVEIKTEEPDEFELTELTPLKKNGNSDNETNVVSSTTASHKAWEQYEENYSNSVKNNTIVNQLSTKDCIKRKNIDDNDFNNNKKKQKVYRTVLEEFLASYKELETLVIEDWTSNLKFSDSMLNTQKSILTKQAKPLFRKFAESITGFDELLKDGKESFVKQALCPVLGIIITHHFMNKTEEKDAVLSKKPIGSGDDIQELGNFEMAVLCGICLTTQKEYPEDSRGVLAIGRMKDFLRKSSEDLFEVDRYQILVEIATKVCQTST